MNAPAWNSGELAADLRRAIERTGLSLRTAAEQAGVSPSTFSRAAGDSGWPDLSHTNYLKLRAWLDASGRKSAA